MVLIGALLAVAGCGRYFAGPLRPASEQQPSMKVNDDGSVTYTLKRLEISLQPLSDEQLNRQFKSVSEQGAASTNPYTFGNWREPGDRLAPPRFTVFLLTVSNYEYPKVLIDPLDISITTANNRRYQALSFAQLYEYYHAFWLGRTGQGRIDFQTRTDVLRRTMYGADLVFSGQEKQGFVVFPALDDDVRRLQVHVKDIVLRFNYAEQPIERIDLSYSFGREVFRGYEPPPELAVN
jgi:hypothetical protein